MMFNTVVMVDGSNGAGSVVVVVEVVIAVVVL